jgi:hypothetical protein
MSDSSTPQDDAAMSPASAGSRGDRCRCGLATRLVGDGCEHCNPAMMIDILREQIADMRLTDEERAFLELHAQRLVGWSRSSDDSKRELVTVRGLLGRLG